MGVSWYFPPKGISTVPAPMVESNRSDRPRLEQMFRSASHGEEVLGEAAGHGLAVALRLLGGGVHVLGRAVGVQEFPAEVARLFFPFQFITRRGLSVTTATGTASRFSVAASSRNRAASFGFHDHGHALLGFGDGQLGAVQTVILLGHGVQIDFQAVGQLADGHGHAARAKVVAALDETGGFAVAEQALELPLLGGVALLHLASRRFPRTAGCELLEEPVAPPMPSRPVRPPSRMTTSPGSGRSRRTFSAGAAAMTAPISMRLAA